jgi:hypothetical protein
MKGRYGFNSKNSYAFISVTCQFARTAERIMKQEGFCLRYLIRKNKFPGIYFKFTYIDIKVMFLSGSYLSYDALGVQLCGHSASQLC